MPIYDHICPSWAGLPKCARFWLREWFRFQEPLGSENGFHTAFVVCLMAGDCGKRCWCHRHFQTGWCLSLRTRGSLGFVLLILDTVRFYSGMAHNNIPPGMEGWMLNITSFRCPGWLAFWATPKTCRIPSRSPRKTLWRHFREQSQPVDGLQIVSRCRRVHRQQAERFVLGSRTSVLTQSVALHTFYTTNIGRRLEHIAELKYGTRMD